MHPKAIRNSDTLKLSTKGERELVITRQFDAPRRLVFEAMTRPELLKRWLLGPPGWIMAVCEVDLRVGGAYRYVWRHENGEEMGMGGVFKEVTPPQRYVGTEKFDQAWYPGEALGTTELTERNGRTTLTITMQYDSRQTRDAVLQSPMERGLGYSYDRLEEVLGLPQIVKTEAQLAAVIHLTIPRAKMREMMGPAMQEVKAALAAQGVAATGPMFSYHFRMDPAVFDFMVGMPVAQAVSAVGRVHAAELPAATVARFNYSGPYEGLDSGWRELMAWIEAQEHKPRPDLWECYVRGPESGADPGQWCTQLNRPLEA